MTKGRRHTPQQIMFLLRQIEADTSNGKDVSRACYDAGIREPTYYRWYRQFGNLEIDQANRMLALERENRRLRRYVEKLSS